MESNHDLRRCSRCILPETYPRLTFDTAGVCSVCRKATGGSLNLLGEEALRAIVNKHRRPEGRWDSLAALSGGRDSTYALYYAVRKLGLRPLAFTIDQGVIPAETWRSIENATRILGVEHVVVRHDLLQKSLKPLLRAWLRKPSAAMVSFMCLGCRLGMRKGFLQVARQYGLPLCVSGGGEPEGSFATAFFTARTGHVGQVLGLLRGIGLEFVRNPAYFVPPTNAIRMALEFLYEYPPAGFIRRLVRPNWVYAELFRYIPYDEAEITRVMREVGWEPYHHSAANWRADCKVSLLKNVLYQQTLGFTKHDELISGLIRGGAITREAGLERLAHDNRIPPEFFNELVTELGLKPAGVRR